MGRSPHLPVPALGLSRTSLAPHLGWELSSRSGGTGRIPEASALPGLQGRLSRRRQGLAWRPSCTLRDLRLLNRACRTLRPDFQRLR